MYDVISQAFHPALGSKRTSLSIVLLENAQAGTNNANYGDHVTVHRSTYFHYYEPNTIAQTNKKKTIQSTE